jgi:hypothetical protein
VGDIGVDGRLTLNCIFGKQCVNMGTRLNWFAIVSMPDSFNGNASCLEAEIFLTSSVTILKKDRSPRSYF